MKKIFPFVEIEGQDDLKLAILLNLIDRNISGVLIRGEKGTGKSTAVRGIGDLLQRHNQGIKVVELPVNATEDRVVGSINIEQVLKSGEKKFEPGILKEADGNILYIDEVNLLEDHIVDLLLDAAAMGVNTVEREGISYSHPSKFVLIGTMNPEEGELRPQLLDRFGLIVDIKSEEDIGVRKEIIRKRLSFEEDFQGFIRSAEEKEDELIKKIHDAKARRRKVKVGDDILESVARISLELKVDGHRGDLTMIRAAEAYAAFLGDGEVKKEHILRLLPMVYAHRLRKKPFEEIQVDKLDDVSRLIDEV